MIKKVTLVLFLALSSICFGAIDFEYKNKKNRADLIVSNTFLAPVTIEFDFELENVTPIKKNIYVLPSRKKVKLITFKRHDKKKKWRYKFKYNYRYGVHGKRQSKNAKYNLPFKKGFDFEAGQGFNGKFSHFGNSVYAVDFRVPVGTEIYPARQGGLLVSKISLVRVGLQSILKRRLIMF